jgi:hypothetical protein
MRLLERVSKLLYIKFFKPDFAILDCKDVTSEYAVEKGERVFHVEYYKNGKWYIRRIWFTGKYSDAEELRALQEYCVERVKHVRENVN